jgi:3-hydroxyacyl-CoA dehydrogenase
MEDVEQRMALLTGSLDMKSWPTATWSSRRCSRTWTIKKEVFAKLDAIASPARSSPPTPRRSNVNEIAAATKRPESVIGMHFFSPANVMKLLEIVRGDQDLRRP